MLETDRFVRGVGSNGHGIECSVSWVAEDLLSLDVSHVAS